MERFMYMSIDKTFIKLNLSDLCHVLFYKRPSVYTGK